MGAGDGLVIASCVRHAATTGSSSTRRAGPARRRPLLPGATFISNVGGTTNYTAPDISTVFACIAALGQAGCGFEHRSRRCCARWAPTASPLPAENQGFLRADALLAIVMVTNEDDCSTRRRRPARLLRQRRRTSSRVAASVRPRTTAATSSATCATASGRRAWRRTGRSGDTVTLQNCTSSECDGLLTPVAEVAARIKALKAAPASEILVAAITGPATPYQVHWRRRRGADTSCGIGVVPLAADHALVHGDRQQLRRPGRSRHSAGRRLRRERLRVVDLRRRLRARAAADRDADRDVAGGRRRHGRPGRSDSQLRGHRSRWRHRCGRRRRRRRGRQHAAAALRSAATRRRATGMSSGSGCGCQTGGGAAAGISGFGAAGAIIAGLAARRRRRRRACRNTEPRVIRAAQPPPGRQLRS